MSWCDKLASTPTVGMRLDPNYASSDSINDALRPILNRHARPLGRPGFNIERIESHALGFSTDEGFAYAIEPININVAFRHSMKAKPTSAGLPVMEMLSSPAPFTSILPQAIEHLSEVAALIPSQPGRKVRRIGIVATTTVADDDMPPGVTSLISYFGRPWAGKLDTFNIRIAAELRSTSSHTDRCIYSLIKPEDGEDMLNTLMFDWQRTFVDGEGLDRGSLEKLMTTGARFAMEHFEEIAEGSRWDEHLLSSASAA